MTEGNQEKRGPLFKIDWPRVLSKVKSDPELKVWMLYASHWNDKILPRLGDKLIGDKTGLWLCTIDKVKQALEACKLMKQVDVHTGDNGLETEIYEVEGVEFWDGKELFANVLPLYNMREKNFLMLPFLKVWRKSDEKERGQRISKGRILTALCWLIAATEMVGEPPWDIAPPRVADCFRVCKMLEEKMKISERQARRYIALLLESKVIQRVDWPPFFDDNGLEVVRYQFSEWFTYEWLRLPPKEEEDPDGALEDIQSPGHEAYVMAD